MLNQMNQISSRLRKAQPQPVSSAKNSSWLNLMQPPWFNMGEPGPQKVTDFVLSRRRKHYIPGLLPTLGSPFLHAPHIPTSAAVSGRGESALETPGLHTSTHLSQLCINLLLCFFLAHRHSSVWFLSCFVCVSLPFTQFKMKLIQDSKK